MFMSASFVFPLHPRCVGSAGIHRVLQEVYMILVPMSFAAVVGSSRVRHVTGLTLMAPHMCARIAWAVMLIMMEKMVTAYLLPLIFFCVGLSECTRIVMPELVFTFYSLTIVNGCETFGIGKSVSFRTPHLDQVMNRGGPLNKEPTRGCS